MLQALATNPGELDGVWTQGSMEKGVIEALEQVGREVPTVTMGNPDQAGLAYWRDHAADGYQGVATASPSAAAADAMFRIGMRVMEGKKPRISSIAGAPPLIVDAACHPALLPEIVRLASPAGRIGLLGFSATPSELVQLEIIKKELTLVGSRLNNGRFPRVIELLATGRLDAAALISHQVASQEMPGAIELIERHPEQTRKVLVQWGGNA